MDSDKLKKIPIVGLTAFNDERSACLKAGMKRFCKHLFEYESNAHIVTKPARYNDIKQIYFDLLAKKL